MNTTLFNYRIATITSLIVDDTVEASKLLPMPLQTHINQRKSAHDKAASTQTWLLLKDYLLEQGLNQHDWFSHIQFSRAGKPSFQQTFPIMHFNFSHAAEKVICAISNSQLIGVDIEKIVSFDYAVLNSYFTVSEANYIAQAVNQAYAFFTLWTKKEALLKCVGIGIASIDLATIEVLADSVIYQQKQYTFYPINAGMEYVAYACLCDVNNPV